MLADIVDNFQLGSICEFDQQPLCYMCPSVISGSCRNVNDTLKQETETSGFQSETETIPDFSEAGLLAFSPRQDRDRPRFFRG